jgi:mRNA interferase MazF
MGASTVPKNKVVLVEFPFSDRQRFKVRPALLLTAPRGQYREVLVAFISSTIPDTLETTDVVLDPRDSDFGKTGLKVPSVIRLHKLACLSRKLLRRELGYLTLRLLQQISDGLRCLFALGDSTGGAAARSSLRS